MRTAKSRIGTKLGSWTILGIDRIDGRTGSIFICRCACGAKKLIQGRSLLRSDGSRSCRKCFLARKRPKRWSRKYAQKYPVNLAVVGRALGLSRSAIHQRVKRHGFEAAMKYYKWKF